MRISYFVKLVSFDMTPTACAPYSLVEHTRKQKYSFIRYDVCATYTVYFYIVFVNAKQIHAKKTANKKNSHQQTIA